MSKHPRTASCGLGLALLAGACSGRQSDIPATLRLADLNDAEISRLASAATASDLFQAQAAVMQFDDTPAGGCPAVTIAGNTVTVTGGCAVVDGPMLTGSAQVVNPLGWGDLEPDVSAAQEFTFTDFRLDYTGFVSGYSGTMRMMLGLSELEADLTVDLAGVAVRSDLYMECSASSRECEHDGTGLELVGRGGVHVRGGFEVGSATAAGEITLAGADEVVVTLAGQCISWRVVGTGRMFSTCP